MLDTPTLIGAPVAVDWAPACVSPEDEAFAAPDVLPPQPARDETVIPTAIAMHKTFFILLML